MGDQHRRWQLHGVLCLRRYQVDGRIIHEAYDRCIFFCGLLEEHLWELWHGMDLILLHAGFGAVVVTLLLAHTLSIIAKMHFRHARYIKYGPTGSLI